MAGMIPARARANFQLPDAIVVFHPEPCPEGAGIESPAPSALKRPSTVVHVVEAQPSEIDLEFVC